MGSPRRWRRRVMFAEEVPRQVEEEIGQQMQAQATLVAELVAIADAAKLPPADINARLAARGRRKRHRRSMPPGPKATSTCRRATSTSRSHPIRRSSRRPTSSQAPLRERAVSSSKSRGSGRSTTACSNTSASVAWMNHDRAGGDGGDVSPAARPAAGLRRFVNEVVAGEVREVQILDDRLTPMVSAPHRRRTGRRVGREHAPPRRRRGSRQGVCRHGPADRPVFSRQLSRGCTDSPR